VSSGRTGLVLALEAMGAGRADLVGLFPYASSCVVEAVGRVATPVGGPAALAAGLRLVYHQWGFVQERGLGTAVLEDAVDSFCEPGAELFPAGGEYEVWSLSKLLGSLGGGVVWCRDVAIAREMRERRDCRNGLTAARWGARLLSTRWPAWGALWHGAEVAAGAPPRWGCGEILRRIERWHMLLQERGVRVGMVRPHLPSWLETAPGRIPTAIPVVVDSDQATALERIGFTTGVRHMERVRSGHRDLVRLFPIPVHQDVPLAALERALAVVA
jgi:putative PLP-dependent aminotransferase (TIGR04422 family)